MTVLEQIKQAVRAGKIVCEGTPFGPYRVKKHDFRDGSEQWLIHFIHSDYCLGLTHADDVTLNGKHFFLGDEEIKETT